MINGLGTLYRDSLSLLTDLYQLTMAYGYWKSGVAEREAVFHLFFRANPFQGGYTVACGLATAIEYIEGLRFREDDLAYLATLRGADDRPLFERGFLDYLGALQPSLDVDAVPEGTVVFAQEPLVRVTGPVLQCQLLETPLLTIVNFQTLVATKAARVTSAAGGGPVLEFGLRRAQGPDGGVSAARAAYVGGCAATSNLLAGKLYDIPVKGTHAHSWVMFFDDELAAFERYAEALPNNCVFLVDTYDTLEGVRHAVEVGKRLRAAGHELLGVRLDSGDLAYLSIEARRLLDEGGFPDARVFASSDLDEHVIASLRQQGARIAVWGVGTKLATAYDQPALGGVYKLGAVRAGDGSWDFRIKLSEQPIKTTNPGVLQVRRFLRDGEMIGDMIYDTGTGVTDEARMWDILDPTRSRPLAGATDQADLLQPIFRGGRRVYQPPTVHEARANAAAQLRQLSPRMQRFLNPHEYPVGLEDALHQRKRELVHRARVAARRPA